MATIAATLTRRLSYFSILLVVGGAFVRNKCKKWKTIENGLKAGNEKKKKAEKKHPPLWEDGNLGKHRKLDKKE